MIMKFLADWFIENGALVEIAATTAEFSSPAYQDTRDDIKVHYIPAMKILALLLAFLANVAIASFLFSLEKYWNNFREILGTSSASGKPRSNVAPLSTALGQGNTSEKVELML